MLRTKQVNSDMIIYLSGRLDVHLSAEIEKELNDIIKKNQDSNIVLNLNDVEYMSSSGLRVLVATMRILKSNSRKLHLCNLNQAVLKVFEVVELMDMFDIFDSEEDAVDHF